MVIASYISEQEYSLLTARDEPLITRMFGVDRQR